MSVKDQISSALLDTGREGIDNVINYMERNGFFSVSCHGHHRYEGGMADHAWQTYQLALRAEAGRISAFYKNSLTICALLHDFCDCHGMRHIYGHGKRSAKMLKELGLHLSLDEFLAIRFHWGLKDKEKHPLYEKAKHCHLRYVVHQADRASAKKYRGCD